MTQLSYIEMSDIAAGVTLKEAAGIGCAAIVAGEGVYWVGVASQWWNPVGWVSGALAVTSAACGIWGTYEAVRYLAS